MFIMISTKSFGIITLKKLYFGEVETPCYPLWNFGKFCSTSLERHKPFASRKYANGFCVSGDVNHLQVFRLEMVYLSIIMRDLSHLMVNGCNWFLSLYFYERRKIYMLCDSKLLTFLDCYTWDTSFVCYFAIF